MGDRAGKQITISNLERVSIPVSILGIVAGGITWLNTLHSIALQNQKDIASIMSKYDKIESIDKSVARLESKLEMVLEAHHGRSIWKNHEK